MEKPMDAPQEQEILELHSGVCSALADPKRIMLLYALSNGRRNVGDLAEALGLAQSTTSRHLKVLRERGLVVAERDGASIYYALADHSLIEALDLLRGVLRGVYTRRSAAIEAAI
jgi:DNA-binding transcriptional ArsR family regulator